MSFPLVLKSVTLNDLERRNGSYFALFKRFAKSAIQLITASPKSIWAFDWYQNRWLWM